MSQILNGKSPALFNNALLERTDKPKMLDLFCGAGGATKGYQSIGYFVVGLDIKWQPHYCGDMFINSEAVSWLEHNMDEVKETYVAIHASPPCQGYSNLTAQRDNHPKLVTRVRELLLETGLPYIIENVEGYFTGMVNPFRLCGSSFKLRVRRHRLFETSFPVRPLPCDHEWQDNDPIFVTYDHNRWSWRGFVNPYGQGSGKAREYWPWAMGMGKTWDECWMTQYELTQAIPPMYTAYVGAAIPSHAFRR
jgi:DNA (cytosine-5)-methyltransferase 1